MVFYYFLSKITFCGKLFSECCDKFDYQWSIVYLSCYHVILARSEGCYYKITMMIFIYSTNLFQKLQIFLRDTLYDFCQHGQFPCKAEKTKDAMVSTMSGLSGFVRIFGNIAKCQ